MENQIQIAPPPLFALVNIALVKANFERPSIINNLNEKGQLDLSKIKEESFVNVYFSDLTLDTFGVYLDISFKTIHQDQLLVDLKVIQCGNFNKVGKPTEDELMSFVNVNAPAIIFPFTREIVASLTTKSLLGSILLQPVNFVQLYNDRKQKKAN